MTAAIIVSSSNSSVSTKALLPSCPHDLKAWNLQGGTCGCQIHTHICARKPPQLSFTVVLTDAALVCWKCLWKIDEWRFTHTLMVTLHLAIFFYLVGEPWDSLTFTSSSLILPLFSGCLHPAALRLSGLKAVRRNNRLQGPWKFCSIWEHLPGKEHPFKLSGDSC